MTATKSYAQPHVQRVDILSAVLLTPYITFLLRRPMLTVGDTIELALLMVLEIRMVLSATGHVPLTSFEGSFNGALAAAATLIVLNVAITMVPALRERA